MPVTFDPTNKLIVCTLGTVSINMQEVYTAWVDWVASDNMNWLPAFRTVGGDPTEGDNTIAVYYFLTNGWRVRPQEANHTLVVNGILLVDGGGDPYANTVGTYQVKIRAVVPINAEAVIKETGVSGLTAEESAQVAYIPTIESLMATFTGLLDEIHRIHGLKLGEIMEVTRTERRVGDIVQRITGDGEVISRMERLP